MRNIKEILRLRVLGGIAGARRIGLAAEERAAAKAKARQAGREHR